MLARIHRRCLLLIIPGTMFMIFYIANSFSYYTEERLSPRTHDLSRLPSTKDNYHVWLIFTKVYDGSPLKYRFNDLIENLLNISSVPLSLNIIVDNSSRTMADYVINEKMKNLNKSLIYDFHDIDDCAKQMEDIVNVMTLFFGKPGSHYSSVIFFISLGLHRFAPKEQHRAILLDCDILFKKDIAILFDEFERFKDTALFGLAPELSPVYRHVLRNYRLKNSNTTLGDYYHWDKTSNPQIKHARGFQGYNSGVVLLKLDDIRMSLKFQALLKKPALEKLIKKYNFKLGHLGDQDFYTLIGCEYPHLIQTLNCGYNRQLCTWWRDNGYKNVFDDYFKCNHEVVILHGNCKTKLPK